MVRDPLVDPIPGDIVRPKWPKAGKARRVVEYNGTLDMGNLVVYQSVTAKELWGADRICTLKTWERWCRRVKAGVVKRGG